MHHRRGRPKNRRSGCLMCKPHKMNGLKGSFKAKTRKEQKAIIGEEEQREELLQDGYLVLNVEIKKPCKGGD